MKTSAGRSEWVEIMTTAIRRQSYFRVHDSGDMFSSAYAQCWLEICKALPETKFWIPTRAWQQPSGPLPVFDPLLGTLRQLAALPNVTVRPSALNFGDAAPVVAGLHAGSTSENTQAARLCPAPVQNRHCGDCRTCWDERSTAVSYARH
jgi:hypothetical protein